MATPTTPDGDELLRVDDVQAMLRCGRSTIYGWIRTGVIPVVRPHPRGAFWLRRSDVEKALMPRRWMKPR